MTGRVPDKPHKLEDASSSLVPATRYQCSVTVAQRSPKPLGLGSNPSTGAYGTVSKRFKEQSCNLCIRQFESDQYLHIWPGLSHES